MWTRQELKEKAKASVKANYWKNVLVAFILSLLTAATSMYSSSNMNEDGQQVQQNLSTGEILAVLGVFAVVLVIYVLLDFFLWNPLKIGCYAFFKENVATGSAELDNLGKGFNGYGHKFATMFLSGLYLFLWSLLFIVPGIIKGYSYRMVAFIVQDNPELTANEVIKKSQEMMNGHKWDTFVLDLSFIGWSILSIFTLGLVGIFWVNPYYQNTNAALYRRLSGQDAQDAVVAAADDAVVTVE